MPWQHTHWVIVTTVSDIWRARDSIVSSIGLSLIVETETHTAAPVSSGYGAPPPGPPEAAPVPLEDNPNVSSSQRESLEEAREDYEEAQRQVDEEGSSASSSDLEELQEAREEYLSEAGSAQEELDE